MRTIYRAFGIRDTNIGVSVHVTVKFDRSGAYLILETGEGAVVADLVMSHGEGLVLGNRLKRATKLALREAEDNPSG
jgi:hypothetical protein